LLISTHSVDHTLHSMQALIPNQTGNREDEDDRNLSLIGRGTTLRARSLQKLTNDDDDEEEEEDEVEVSSRWVVKEKNESPKVLTTEKKSSSKKKLK
jgi:hypothetical protein